MSDKIMKSDLLIADLNKHIYKPGELPHWIMSQSALQAVVNGNGDRISNIASSSSSSTSTQTRAPISEVNMVAAMQDHISCTKSPATEILINKGFKKSADSETKITLACELDHMYANCGSGSGSSCGGGDANVTVINRDDPQQVRQLKELLRKNLDIIEQQKEQLRVKDDQMEMLKKENAELKEQIEEQSRWSLLTNNRNNNARREKDFTSADDNDESVQVYGRQKRNRGRRRFHLVAERRKKRLKSLGNESQSSGDCQSGASCSPLSVTDGIGRDKNLGSHVKSKQKNSRTADQNKDVELQTDFMYYTTVGEVPVPPEKARVTDATVLVPSWRIRHVTSCYQLEGTENLDDEAFLKRHQKLEIDEKRRKRWDIQRIREQRLQDKLRSGRRGNKEVKRNNSPELMTFYPQPEDAQYIEISDKLPVTAFGIPIPHVEPCEFSLPWAIKCGKHLRSDESRRGT